METSFTSPRRPFAAARRPLRRAAGWLLLALLVAPVSGAPPVRQIDYQLKAGFLYNFAKFVEWPPPPLPAGTPFRIGIIADANVHAAIAETLRGRAVDGHPVEVLLLGPADDASLCRIVFIPRSSPLTPAQFRARLPDRAVLLVGEQDGFAAAGGEIGFLPRGDNLRYQVNLTAARRVGLKLSARLASLAEVVPSAEP